jgi:cell division protease FtsH
MFALIALSTTTRNWMIAAAVFAALVAFGRFQERRARTAPYKAARGSAPTGFAAVAGCDEAVEDLREVVEILRNPERFSRLGATPPRGALLVGPPGTGKTLLARAVAQEANVPFIAASATDFVEMYVGVGAKRVRDLYASARSHGTAIVFIDEIDAVARARSMNDRENGTPGGPIEHENTLIALLTELDGFDRSNVFTIAATNRPDVLDAALTRPGRLERRVEVPLPDMAGRERILTVHAAKMPLDTDVSLTDVAARTPGFSGADLARVCNEAAIIAARQERDMVAGACFGEAVELLALGRPRLSRQVSAKDRRITAWHEAGHAICAAVLDDAPDPVAVSVVPRGPAAGVTWFASDDALFLSKDAAFAQLVVALGGRAAEEVLLGGSCTQGAAGDLASATSLATQMVASFGMGSSLLSRSSKLLTGPDAFTATAAGDLLDRAHTTAKELLATHAAALEQLAATLIETGQVDGATVQSIIGSHPDERRVGASRVEPITAPERTAATSGRQRIPRIHVVRRVVAHTTRAARALRPRTSTRRKA